MSPELLGKLGGLDPIALFLKLVNLCQSLGTASDIKQRIKPNICGAKNNAKGLFHPSCMNDWGATVLRPRFRPPPNLFFGVGAFLLRCLCANGLVELGSLRTGFFSHSYYQDAAPRAPGWLSFGIVYNNNFRRQFSFSIIFRINR